MKELYENFKKDYDKYFKGKYAYCNHERTGYLKKKVELTTCDKNGRELIWSGFNVKLYVPPIEMMGYTLIEYSVQRFYYEDEDYEDYEADKTKLIEKKYKILFNKNYILNLAKVMDELRSLGVYVNATTLTTLRKEANNALWMLEKPKKIELVFDEPVSYLIKDELTGYYKMGISKRPIQREKTLQAERPVIKLVKIFDKNVENHLHYKYRRERLRGEWFNLTKLQVHYICTHY